MESLKTLIPLIFSGSLAALVLAVGLDATLDDVLYLLRRPKLLGRAFLAISVVVPVTAVLVVNALPISLPAKVGVILMALAPVPPLVPGKDLKLGGRKEYVYGLYVAFAVLTVLIVPATVVVLDRLYGAQADAPFSKLVQTVLVSVLLPLALGMGARTLWPTFAARITPWVSRLSMLLLVIACIPLFIQAWPAMMGLVGDGTVLAVTLIVAVAIAGGHLLGGPDPRDRAALAGAAATRHPGIAMMIASLNSADKRVTAMILLFLLQAVVIVAIYQAILKHTARGKAETVGKPAR